MNVKNRESCRELFKKLNILPLQSQYILSLLLFVVKNLNMFKSNSVVHTINTKNSSDLYLPSAHLSKVQKGVYHSGIKVFKSTFKNKRFIWRCDEIQISFKKVSFGRFILTIQEYFDWNLMTNPGTSY